MSAKSLSGKTSFIPENITIQRYSTQFKIRPCFLMNINRNYVSLETKFCSVCVFLIVTLTASFSRSYSTFPLCSVTTLIQIAIYNKMSLATRQENLNLRLRNEVIHYHTHHHSNLFHQPVYFQKFPLKTVD